MIKVPQSPESGPLDQLRRLIEQADSCLGGLERSSTSDALSLLGMLDQIDSLHSELAEKDVDLRAESTRIETILLTLRRKAGVVLRLLRQRGGIAAVRAPLSPPHERWWWYLDQYVAQQHRQTLRGLARTGVILLVLLAVATLAYRTVLRPDPTVIAHMGYVQDAQRSIDQGDLNAALQATDKGLAQFPDDGEILLWRGTILTLMKRPQEADAAFNAARSAYPDEATYLVNRATVRTQANDIDGAYVDALAATQRAPDSAQAFLVLGGAQELRGERQQAAQSYSTAATLAASKKDSQLEAMAKVRMAMMMQAAPMPGFPTPQPTP